MTAPIAVGRHDGTVVVTVRGDLDRPWAAHLGHVLADLIDGQGNLDVIVDLGAANARDARGVSVFAEAVHRARRRGGLIRLRTPPPPLCEALRAMGLGRQVIP